MLLSAISYDYLNPLIHLGLQNQTKFDKICHDIHLTRWRDKEYKESYLGGVVFR